MRYGLVFIFWILTVACGAPDTVLKAADSESLLQYLYGNYDAASETANFETQDKAILSRLYQELPMGELPPNQATVLRLDKVEYAGRRILFAVVAIRPDPTKADDWGCAICGPLLRFMSFDYDGESGWKKETDQYVSARGNWGAAPDVRLEKIGNGRHGFILTSPPIPDFTNSERQTIVGLGEGGFSIWLEFDSRDKADADNCPGQACWEYQTELQFIESDESFFGLRLETQGFKLDAEGRRVSADGARCYRTHDIADSKIHLVEAECPVIKSK